MPIADASRVQLLIRPETAYAEVPPANAPMTRLRNTGDTLGIRKATVLSDELRSDRQRTDMPMVGVSAGGDISMEAIYGAEFDLLLQAALGGTWGTPSLNNLRNGVINRSFGIERGMMDVGQFIYYRGMIVERFAFDINARAIARVTVGLMGQRGVTASTSAAGTTTPTEPSAQEPMKAGSSVSILSAGTANIEMVGVQARRLTLDINQGLRERELATSDYNAELGRNVMEITGSIETYFEDRDRYDAFLTNQKFAARFRITDPTKTTGGNTYEFTLPKLIITDAPLESPGNDNDIMQAFSFRALVDVGVGYTVNVERGTQI